MIPVRGPQAWSWNESTERPTFAPSILVHSHERYEAPPQPRCHSFVRNGTIEYLSDSTHTLAGKTVLLPDWEDDAVLFI